MCCGEPILKEIDDECACDRRECAICEDDEEPYE
jgi:hypothetical protein